MSAPPQGLLAAAKFNADVDRWWTRLPAQERRRLAVLFDARMDSGSFRHAERRDGSSAWHRVKIEVRGRFVDEDPGGDEGAFPVDFYEYLVNHEILMDEGPRYHICTAHEAAASVVRAGKIPATFSCPLGRSSCPMRRVLALDPGRSLRLRVHLAAVTRP